MKKKEFYKYYDIIDIRSKLFLIEKKAEKENRISWEILIEEIKKNVIINEDIREFIQKTERNNKISNLYFNSINIYTHEDQERVNNENIDNFNKMKINLINDNIQNKEFYNTQKKYINNDINFINLLYKKSCSENNIKIDKILGDKVEVLQTRRNYLYLFYKNKKDFISYEDDLLMNFKYINDIKHIDKYLYNNSKIYLHVKLPKTIKIKEYNIYGINYYYYNNKKPDLYKYNIILSLNTKMFVEIYKKNIFSNFNYYFDIYDLFHNLCIIYIYIVLFILKQILWLFYKFIKTS